MTVMDGMVAISLAAALGDPVWDVPDEPVPCVARPGAGLVHLDGACRCFFGGPAPEFVHPLRAL